MPSAAEVGPKYDVLINGEGYRFLEDEKRAAYGISPTFVTRQNVQGNYGDNQQEFWLTYSQNDWSLGAGQRFYRANDEEASRRFWRGGVDVSQPGQFTLNRSFANKTTTGNPVSGCGHGTGPKYAVCDTTKLYENTAAGTFTDRGVHGLGAAPRAFGMASDGTDIYMTTTAAGTVGVRKWDGSAFSTFSASGADSIAFLNNTLYGFRYDTAKLVKWDSSGTQSDIFQWKQADGGVRGGNGANIVAFGGKLLILWGDGPSGGAELWLYDGVAPALLNAFPGNFYGQQVAVMGGVAVVSGVTLSISNAAASGNPGYRPTLYYVSGGTVGVLWQPDEDIIHGSFVQPTSLARTAMDAFGHGLMFFGPETALSPEGPRGLMFYDATTGGVREIDDELGGGVAARVISAGSNVIVFAGDTTTTKQFFSTAYDVASLHTSLIDFDSSLTKYFKSVKFDGTLNSQTVTLAYKVDTLAGSGTTITAAAQPGTEYAIGATGKAISIRVGLDSANPGPSVIKRIFVRAAPIQDTFKKRQYVLDLSGKDGESPIVLRDGTLHTKDGVAMAQDINTAMVATTPFTIVDRFGSFTGLIEPDSSEIIEVRPEVFVARITVREV